MQCESRQRQPRAGSVDFLGQFRKVIEGRADGRASVAIALVIEQAPLACRRPLQRLDQRRAILRFQFDAPGVEPFEAIRFCHPWGCKGRSRYGQSGSS